MYGDLLYESGSSRNPLSDALLDSLIYSKCRTYKHVVLSHRRLENRGVDFKSLPPHLLLQKVGFLLVGHTHEDIDGTNRRIFSNLKSI